MESGSGQDAQQGKTVLITGATDGLGRAAALLFAERGYHVFAGGRSAEKRAQLDAFARQRNLPLESLEMDVCDEGSVQHAIAQIFAKVPALDVLVNNAGVAYVASFEDMRMEDWRRQFEVNFFGLIRVTQAVLPRMRERRSGRILMMSSVSGLVTPPTQAAYSASKHAVEALANALRHELHPFNVKTVLIEPGYIVTGIQKTAEALAQPYAEKMQNGPYAPIYATTRASANSSRAASEATPEHCARVMLEALEAKNPKPRYGVTRLARIVKIGKRLVPDSVLDAQIRRRYHIPDRL
jgi:NAD(P)-dependent dehydrogenase (short-subunit alcohol dehydrogenase family)